MRRVVFLALIAISFLFFIGCKADSVEIEVYSSDFSNVLANEVCEIPVVLKFKLMGSDNSEEIEQATVIARKYLKDSEYITTPGDFGDVFIVKTVIPFGKKDQLDGYFKSNCPPIALFVENNVATFRETPFLANINSELKAINYMLSFELPAGDTKIRIVGDTTQKLEVSAIAVFVDEKPFLTCTKEIEKRKSISISFRGGDGSVYSEIGPQFSFIFK